RTAIYTQAAITTSSPLSIQTGPARRRTPYLSGPKGTSSGATTAPWTATNCEPRCSNTWANTTSHEHHSFRADDHSVERSYRSTTCGPERVRNRGQSRGDYGSLRGHRLSAAVRDLQCRSALVAWHPLNWLTQEQDSVR